MGLSLVEGVLTGVCRSGPFEQCVQTSLEEVTTTNHSGLRRFLSCATLPKPDLNRQALPLSKPPLICLWIGFSASSTQRS